MASSSNDDSCTQVVYIKRKNMCEVFFNAKHSSFSQKFDEVQKFIYQATSSPVNCLNRRNSPLKNFKKQFKLKWEACNRHKERFLRREKCWLEGSCVFQTNRPPRSRGGRPLLDFQASSEQTKRKKTAVLRAENSPDALIYAAQMQLRASGKKFEADVVKKVTEIPGFAQEQLKSSYVQKVTYLPPVDALSMLIEAELSKKQYNVIRSYAKHIFPPYKLVQKEKLKCYPENILLKESEAEVSLQSLLDHTASRLLSAQKDVVNSIDVSNSLTLISKWGFDGSSSHTQYKQKFTSELDDDKFVFITSLVPLRLESEVNKNIIVWNNPRPSSSRYCRPISLQYLKETEELAKGKKTEIDEQIQNLHATSVTIDEKEYSVSHKTIFTMIDGKLCNALSETSRLDNITDIFNRLLISSDPFITNSKKTTNFKEKIIRFGSL